MGDHFFKKKIMKVVQSSFEDALKLNVNSCKL